MIKVNFGDIFVLLCLVGIIVIETYRLFTDGINYDVILILMLSSSLVLYIINDVNVLEEGK